MEASEATQEITTEPTRGWHFPDMRELWAYRDLIYFLGRREIVMRYKQAAVGAFWAILQPLLLAGLFAIFLGVVAKVESAGLPYPLLAVTGLVLWIPWSRGVDLGTNSTVGFEGLITKIYLPRAALPLTSLASPALDMLVGFGIALAIAAGYGFFPSPKLLAVPVIFLVSLLVALGLALWFSALNVKYRDFALGVPTLMLMGLFLTPITYPLELVQDTINPQFQFLYSLNPMVGLIEAYRWALIDGSPLPSAQILAVPVIASVILVVTGALYYERAQREFADVI